MTGLSQDAIDAKQPSEPQGQDAAAVETLTLTAEEHGVGRGMESEARRLAAQFAARSARREAEHARRHPEDRSPAYHLIDPLAPSDPGYPPRRSGGHAEPMLETRRGFSHMSREDEAVARLRQIAGSLHNGPVHRGGRRGEVRIMNQADGGKTDWASMEAPSREEIEAIAADAYAALPKAFRDLCNGVAIMVRDFAEDDVLDQLGVENEFDLLGLYEGIAITEASHIDVVKDFHRIFLYRRPILDYWLEHHETLGAVITHVLVHEIGHHFGLSDADMEAIERSVR